MAMTKFQETFTLYDGGMQGSGGACGIIFTEAEIIVEKLQSGRWPSIVSTMVGALLLMGRGGQLFFIVL